MAPYTTNGAARRPFRLRMKRPHHTHPHHAVHHETEHEHPPHVIEMFAPPPSEREIALWKKLTLELPSERDDAHKVQRSAAFKSLDKDRDGRLTLTDIKLGFTQGDFAKTLAEMRELASFHGAWMNDYETLLRDAMDMASKVLPNAAHGQAIKDHGEPYVEREQFRLLLVYIRHYFELFTMFEDVEHLCHHDHDEPLNLQDFCAIVP